MFVGTVIDGRKKDNPSAFQRRHMNLKKDTKEAVILPQHIASEFVLGDPFFDSLGQNCSCLIGLHPDQATEPIVRAALAHKRPFAVVPCCVFPRESPDRRVIKKGQEVPVILYEDFVEYLENLVKNAGGKVQKDFLPMHGKNQVVYCLEYDDLKTSSLVKYAKSNRHGLTGADSNVESDSSRIDPSSLEEDETTLLTEENLDEQTEITRTQVQLEPRLELETNRSVRGSDKIVLPVPSSKRMKISST